ncbi:MAG TPA: carboxypeptidase-like regulatory domain-containing protein [Chitinivibrionales bacterium]|jgi:hypothetical protein|nr:carboxypeptidase-like regulatory domain-containing protein [Chitinivibrionales bacterium]
MKALSLFPLMLFVLLGCDLSPKGYVCPDCTSAALKIRLQDASSGQAIVHARIKVTDNKGDTLVACDTCAQPYPFWLDADSTYGFSGGPATYQATISHPAYDSAIITGITVTQYPQYTCEYANTKYLVVALDRRAMAKRSAAAGYTIVSEYEKAGCM